MEKDTGGEKRALPSPDDFELEVADLAASKPNKSIWAASGSFFVGLGTSVGLLLCVVFLFSNYQQHSSGAPLIAGFPPAITPVESHYALPKPGDGLADVQITSTTVSSTSSSSSSSSTSSSSSSAAIDPPAFPQDSDAISEPNPVSTAASSSSSTSDETSTAESEPAEATASSIAPVATTEATTSSVASTTVTEASTPSMASTAIEATDSSTTQTAITSTETDSFRIASTTVSSSIPLESGGTNPENATIIQGGQLEPQGPDQPPIRKAVIAATAFGSKEKLDWMTTELPGWTAYRYIYEGNEKLYPIDADENYKKKANWGRESNVYLTFIIEHYEDLPDYMVFIHGQRYQSHNDDPMYDTVPEIVNLNLSYIDEIGYSNLRCSQGNGCPNPYVRPKLGHEDGFWEFQGMYADMFHTFFPNRPVPKRVGAPCCAQFVVTKEKILGIPKKRWRLIQRTIWKHRDGFGGIGSMKTGLVMEYMWHIIFGQPAFFCSTVPKECYCKQWGLCNLKCDKGNLSCRGRVWIPPSHELPKEWPIKGQGKRNWPYEGWWKNKTEVEQHNYRRSLDDGNYCGDDADDGYELNVRRALGLEYSAERKPYPFDLPHSSFPDDL